MKAFRGWPVAYAGIALLSAGCWINSGVDAGLIVAGFCLIVVGIGQTCAS